MLERKFLFQTIILRLRCALKNLTFLAPNRFPIMVGSGFLNRISQGSKSEPSDKHRRLIPHRAVGACEARLPWEGSGSNDHRFTEKLQGGSVLLMWMWWELVCV